LFANRSGQHSRGSLLAEHAGDHVGCGIGRLVVVGQHTDCCVRHTSYDAFQRGLELAVAADATTVFEPLSESPVMDRQQAALDYLSTFYGVEVLASNDIL